MQEWYLTNIQLSASNTVHCIPKHVRASAGRQTCIHKFGQNEAYHLQADADTHPFWRQWFGRRLNHSEWQQAISVCLQMNVNHYESFVKIQLSRPAFNAMFTVYLPARTSYWAWAWAWACAVLCATVRCASLGFGFACCCNPADHSTFTSGETGYNLSPVRYVMSMVCARSLRRFAQWASSTRPVR